MFERIFIGAFGKIMIGIVLLLLTTNILSCYEKKVAQEKLITSQQEVALVRADNQNLANQLENTQLQIKQYQQQVKALHNNVLAKLQQAEQRSYDIMQQLEKNKTWSNQSVPTNISKLFNAAQKPDKTQSTTLPERATVPKAEPTHQK